MPQTILLFQTEEVLRINLERQLCNAGMAIRVCASYAQLMSDIARGDVAVIVIELTDDIPSSVLFPFTRLRGRFPWIQLIVLTRGNTVPSLKQRSICQLSFPIDASLLIRSIRYAVHQCRKVYRQTQSQTHLAAIMRSIRDGMIAIDRELCLTSFNSAAATYCQLAPGNLRQPFDRDHLCCSGQCLTLLREAIQRVETVERPHVECRLADGPMRIFALTASPLLDTAGEAVGAVMVIRDETRLNTLERNLGERRSFHRLIGGSRQLQGIFELVERLADVTTTVLITGESGTGKELVVDALHNSGNRRNGPLIKFNCAAVSETLLESELFGHVRGAFTGATQDRAGRFELANGGTIFLDEIGDISPRMQLRLLRVLQSRSLERVGGTRSIPIDVRVVAATNADLEALIKAGLFRADLFYRIKVATIHIPPLRERRTDIPLLAEHFLQQFNRRHQRSIMGLTSEAEAVLMRYHWPGNVRELENTLEYAFILCRGDIIGSEHLPPDLSDASGWTPHSDYTQDNHEALQSALSKAGGNKSKAARLLGISRRTLYRHLNDFTHSDN